MSSERRVGSNRSSERELSEPSLIEISFPETENPDSPGKRSLEPEFWYIKPTYGISYPKPTIWAWVMMTTLV